MEVKKQINQNENVNKIEVLKARRTSEEEFAAKVQEEKKQQKDQHIDSNELTQHEDSDDDGLDRDKEDSISAEEKNNLFAGIMNVDDVLAQKAKQKEEKRQKISDWKEKRARMRPLVLFTGTKDDPLPYQKNYKEAMNQEKFKAQQSPKASVLPEIKKNLSAKVQLKSKLSRTNLAARTH